MLGLLNSASSSVLAGMVGGAISAGNSMGGVGGDAGLMSTWDQTFLPELNSLMADANSYASPARIQQAMGQAEAGVSQTFDQSRQNALRDLQSFGIDPSSGRYAQLDAASRAQEAAAQAGAGNVAEQQTEAIGRALRSEAIQATAQLPSQAASMIGANAQAFQVQVNQELGLLNASIQRENANTNMYNAETNRMAPRGVIPGGPAGGKGGQGNGGGSGTTADDQAYAAMLAGDAREDAANDAAAAKGGADYLANNGNNLSGSGRNDPPAGWKDGSGNPVAPGEGSATDKRGSGGGGSAGVNTPGSPSTAMPGAGQLNGPGGASTEGGDDFSPLPTGENPPIPGPQVTVGDNGDLGNVPDDAFGQTQLAGDMPQNDTPDTSDWDAQQTAGTDASNDTGASLPDADTTEDGTGEDPNASNYGDGAIPDMASNPTPDTPDSADTGAWDAAQDSGQDTSADMGSAPTDTSSQDMSSGFDNSDTDTSSSMDNSMSDADMGDSGGGGGGGGDDDSFAAGGAIPSGDPVAAVHARQGAIPTSMSPSGGRETDDVPAVHSGTGEQIRLNSGEFITPKDVVAWRGEGYYQKDIAKARKEMQGATAKPTMKPAIPMGGQ